MSDPSGLHQTQGIGYAAELWTIQALADHVRGTVRSLKSASKSTIWRILNEPEIKPHKLDSYLERRDTEFEPKMRRVLVVYEEVNILNLRGFDPFNEPGVVIVSVDEKPGIQALRSIAAELPPVPGQYQGIGRDYEYERLGTFSLLAGLDLHSGYVHGLVEERHRENSTPIILEIVAFGSSLTITVRTFPKRPWNGLSIDPGRFEYVHTPTHGSWLNIIENAI